MQPLPEELETIADPLSYHCLIWCYTAHLHELALRVYKLPFDSGETFFLIFQMVAYFEGPMTSWQGVDFRLGTLEECRELARSGSIFLPGEDAQEIYFQQFHLFVIDRPEVRVRLFAARNVLKTTDYLDITSHQIPSGD